MAAQNAIVKIAPGQIVELTAGDATSITLQAVSGNDFYAIGNVDATTPIASRYKEGPHFRRR